MPTPVEIVTDFCAMWENPGGDEAMRKHFRPDTVWENVGMVTTTGPDEAIALNASFAAKGVAAMRFDLLAIAAQGNTVLTERVDHMFAADGSTIAEFRVMGAFEVDAAGKIAAWRDYFDTATMMAPD